VEFRQAAGAGGVAFAQDRLAGILQDEIRAVLGSDQVTSDTILSAERGALMMRIREGAQAEAESLGLSVVDVRLKATNLPAQNLEATFARMRAEREREAADEIARGNEAAQRIRATADRTVTETVSEAEREAQITLGEADAEANRIFAEAYGADPEFFGFYRSMQAYENALRGDNSTMVLTPDNPFFGYLYGGEVLAAQNPGSLSDADPAAGGEAEVGADAGSALEPATDGNVTVTVTGEETEPAAEDASAVEPGVGEPVEDDGVGEAGSATEAAAAPATGTGTEQDTP
jgi:membrane protease subunit HflC